MRINAICNGIDPQKLIAGGLVDIPKDSEFDIDFSQTEGDVDFY